MTSQNYHVVFAVIAMREVRFFLEVADILDSKNIGVSFISFFQPGNKLIKDRGYK